VAEAATLAAAAGGSSVSRPSEQLSPDFGQIPMSAVLSIAMSTLVKWLVND
jgi:hypothetical protein